MAWNVKWVLLSLVSSWPVGWGYSLLALLTLDGHGACMHDNEIQTEFAPKFWCWSMHSQTATIRFSVIRIYMHPMSPVEHDKKRAEAKEEPCRQRPYENLKLFFPPLPSYWLLIFLFQINKRADRSGRPAKKFTSRPYAFELFRNSDDDDHDHGDGNERNEIFEQPIFQASGYERYEQPIFQRTEYESFTPIADTSVVHENNGDRYFFVDIAGPEGVSSILIIFWQLPSRVNLLLGSCRIWVMTWDRPLEE